MAAPIFLLCSERSGSNLMRVIMGSHRNICAPAPPHLLRTFYPLVPDYGDLNARSNLVALAQDMTNILQVQYGDWISIGKAEQYIERMDSSSFEDLFNAIYSVEAEAHGKSRYFVKDNGVINHFFQLMAGYPDAKFVYIVRDPRDAVLSWLKSDHHAGGTAFSARVWAQEQSKALLALALTHRKDRIFQLYYEDLVSAPEEMLPRLCEFVGEEFDENMLNFHKTSQAATAADWNTGWKNLVKPMIKSNYGKYRGELSTGKIKLIENLTRREMSLLGYPLDFPEHTRRRVGLDDLGRTLRAGRRFLQLMINPSSRKRGLKKAMGRLREIREIQQRFSAQESGKWGQPRFAAYMNQNKENQ